MHVYPMHFHSSWSQEKRDAKEGAIGDHKKGLPWWLSGKESACQGRTWARSLGWVDPLEENMATHYGRIPWTEEPDGLQSMGSGPKEQTQLSN